MTSAVPRDTLVNKQDELKNTNVQEQRDINFMKRALELANKAEQFNEIPESH